MTVNIAKIDLDTITKFQEKIHLAADDDEEMVSDFYQEFHKTSWYAHLPVQLKSEPGTNGNVTFPVNMTFDYLTYSYMRQRYPALQIKDRFKSRVEISWPHNLGTNIVERGGLYFDDQDAQNIDSVWFDIHSQFFMPPGFRDHHNMSVGNIPILEQWGSYLPAYTTNVDQPWYYGRDTSLAIPILVCSLSKIAHRYTFRDKISKLLRMRCKTKEGWRTIKCNLEFIEGHGDDKLPVPELWGRYAYISDEEREWNKCKTKKVFYIDDIIAIDAEDSAPFGRTVSLDLDCETPCRSIFWVAENEKALNQNNYSNYTTDHTDLHNGWDPVGPISLYYGGQPRLDKMATDHFSVAECRKHFTSPPSEVGYHGYSFSQNPMSIDACVGIVMKDLKVKFSAALNDGNPFLILIKGASNSNDSDSILLDDEGYMTIGDLSSGQPGSGTSSKDNDITTGSGRDIGEQKFFLRVRLLVTKKMRIWTAPKEGKKRELFKPMILQ